MRNTRIADYFDLISTGEKEITSEKNDLDITVYTNSFTTLTTLSYELKQPEKVSLSIYNHLGQLVYKSQEHQPQGKQLLIWSAERYADGVYYCRLQVADEVANGKMVK